MAPEHDENVRIAFALVCAAGASTAIGAAVVFFPRFVKLASRRVLAGSLGFSAGVMSYVSFVEIFQKSIISFEGAGLDAGKAYCYATLCYFGGVVVMMLLNILVSSLLGGHGHRHDAPGTPHDEEHGDNHAHKHKTTRNDVNESLDDVFTPPCCVHDPVEQLNTFHRMASVLQHEQSESAEEDDKERSKCVDVDNEDDFMDNLPLENNLHLEVEEKSEERIQNEDTTQPVTEGSPVDVTERDTKEKKRLVKMGMNTALAIGLHNFPEGLATFVAALNDPKVGTVLAVAIAIHNIPEGLCVALPIFYATGKRTNAFLWACVSGFSEIVAAFLGWLILANVFSEVTYAVLFGLVAGMMVIISIRELIPTAHFYDPEDTVVTNSFIGGMALIALSLVLFRI